MRLVYALFWAPVFNTAVNVAKQVGKGSLLGIIMGGTIIPSKDC